MQAKIKQLFEEVKKIGRGIKNLRFFKLGLLAGLWRVFSRKEKIGLVLLIAVLAADLAVLGSRTYFRHTVPVPAFGSDYTEGEVGLPQFINPLLAQSQTDKDLTTLVYAGLYKLDSNAQLIADLADGMPKISADSKTYTIKLKSNLKWSDGAPLNADDAVFTIATLQDQNFKSPQRKFWANITVQKIDDLTIQLKNKTVSAPFLSNLTLGILPKHLWANIAPEQFALARLNLQPVGSGPYFAKEIRNSADGSLQSITFESYSNYWQSKPYIDHVKINFYRNYEDALLALHSKEIEGLGFIPFDQKIFIDPKTSLQIQKLPVFEYQALFFNLDKSHNVLGDTAVRKALAESVDRNQVISEVYDGLALPAYGPLLPGQLGYNPDQKKNNILNVDAANQVLDQAGWILNPQTGLRAKGKQNLQFSITTNDFNLNQKTADILKTQWRKIGADITINIVSTNDLENKIIRPRNFESLLFAVNTNLDPDPFIFWHSSQSKDPGLNIAQYKNTLADKLISDAHNTFDPAARTADYLQFQNVVAADIPAIFLDQSMFVYEMTPEIKGLELQTLANPENRFYDIVHWYIQTKRVFK